MKKSNQTKLKKRKPGQRNPKLDYSITKQCVICKKKYHPRRNGYEAMSRYCSNECARKGRGKFIPEF